MNNRDVGIIDLRGGFSVFGTATVAETGKRRRHVVLIERQNRGRFALRLCSYSVLPVLLFSQNENLCLTKDHGERIHFCNSPGDEDTDGCLAFPQSSPGGRLLF